MLLVLLVMLLAAVLALAASGRFSHLTNLQLAGTGSLVAAGVAQIVGALFDGTSLARAGLNASAVELALDPRNKQIGDVTRLSWLGHTIPLALPGLGQAIRVGDILIAAGAGPMLYMAMGHPSTVRRARTENRARSRVAETPPRPGRTRPRRPS